MATYSFPKNQELTEMKDLPDPFLKPDSTRISSVEEWEEQREYIKELLNYYVYGELPKEHAVKRSKVLLKETLYDGKAVLEKVEVITDKDLIFSIDIVRPNRVGQFPAIVWSNYRETMGPCPIEEEIVVNRGYVIASFDRQALVPEMGNIYDSPLGKAYPELTWGHIAMWGFSHMLAADFLVTTDYVDTEKMLVTGHSRYGKAALCAGINDTRFSIVAPTGSGCGGTGSFRFTGGRMGENIGITETLHVILTLFPEWFSDHLMEFYGEKPERVREDVKRLSIDEIKAFLSRDLTDVKGKKYDESLMPFDMHFARAAVAPRAIITSDGLGDTWANPYGVQLMWRASQEVFNFLQTPEKNAMHFREGGHAFNALDWKAVIDFADQIYFGKKPETDLVEYPIQDDDWKMQKQHFEWSNPLD